MGQKVIIIGAGGHAKVIADIVLRTNGEILGFLDDLQTEDVQGYPILGTIRDIPNYQWQAAFVIGIGSNDLRKQIHNTYQVEWYTAIHPSACIGKHVSIGKGTVVMANATINPGTTIGNHCIINTASVVEHDNFIEDYVHISPGVLLGGAVSIGECSHICIGAVVKNSIKINHYCTIGAGAVVVKDIVEKGVYAGIPALKIK